MSGIEASDARRYLERWKLVAAAEAAELQATPVVTKLRQLASLMASRALFPEDGSSMPDPELHRRWAAIRHLLGGRG
jgi:hypothetical protein